MATTSKSPASEFDGIDFAPAVIHEVVIPLHDFFHLFHGRRVALAHLHESIDALDFHLGNHGPEPLGAEIGVDAGLRHTDARTQRPHGLELVDERTTLPGLQYMMSRIINI